MAREPDRLIVERNRPLMIVGDNGTELTSRAILQWQVENGVENGPAAAGKALIVFRKSYS